MARMLNDSDFGILSFITSLIFLFGVPSLAIQTIIAKKTTELEKDNYLGKVKGLFSFATRRLFFISLLLILIFEIIFFFIYKKADIPFHILLITSSMVCFSLIYPVIIGIMQGMKKFLVIGGNSLLLFAIKFILSVFLVFIGFRIYGAMIGIIVSAFMAWFIAKLSLRNIKEEKCQVSLYSKKEVLPFIVILIITLMYSFDILLAKFLFSADVMGAYSKVSLLGKMILFAGLSVATVMFPLSSEKNKIKKSSKSILIKSIVLLSAITIAGILIITLFGKDIISLLFGQKYIYLSTIVLPLCLAFGAISFSNLFLMYEIATDKIKSWKIIILTALMLGGIAALILFNKSIVYFSIVFAISSGVTFIFTLYLIIRNKK